MPSDPTRSSRSPSSYSRHHHSSHRSREIGSSSSTSRHRSSRDDEDHHDRRKSHSSRSKTHRDRSRSRSRSPRRKRKRGEEDDDRSSGEEYHPERPQGVDQLDESDFYLKSNELRLWLLEQKKKRFDTLQSEEARRYFRKFINKWNRGLLPTKFYQGISSASLPTTISSSHSWSFSKATQRELDDASYIRKSIDTAHKPLPSNSTSNSTSASTLASRSVVVVGPTMPPVTLGPTMPSSSRLDALRSNRERDANERERSKALDKAERKKAAREAREEEKDGRATGRERQLEKKREFGEIRREIKEGKEPGMVEMNEHDLGLIGPGGDAGSFAAAVAARDQGRNKYQGKKMSIREEKQAEMQDKLQAMRSKEDQTMALLKQMAAERFGPK